jgi:hypothetical protein
LSHRPTRPEQDVCLDCRVVHAGVVTDHGEDEYPYAAPDARGACGGADLVDIESYASTDAED